MGTGTDPEARKLQWVLLSHWLQGWSHFSFRLFFGSCWEVWLTRVWSPAGSPTSLPASGSVLPLVPLVFTGLPHSLLRNSRSPGPQIGPPFFFFPGNSAPFRLSHSLCISLPCSQKTGDASNQNDNNNCFLITIYCFGKSFWFFQGKWYFYLIFFFRSYYKCIFITSTKYFIEYQSCLSALEVKRSIIYNAYLSTPHCPRGSSVESKNNTNFVNLPATYYSVSFGMLFNLSFHVCNTRIIIVLLYVHESHRESC